MAPRRPFLQHLKLLFLAVFPLCAFASDLPVSANSDCSFDSRTAAGEQLERWREISLASESVSRRRPVRPAPGSGILRRNFIDDEIFSTMDKDGIKPTSLSSDEEFLRRIYLDLTGQIPEADAVRAFLADTRADKRSVMVDQLLASDPFVDRWTMWFGDLIQNVQISQFSREYPQGRNAMYRFIRDSFKSGKAYDQIVREVLAGSGDNFIVGPANYAVRQTQFNGPIQDTYDNLSAHSAERFLGMPLTCISCHDGLRHLESVNIYLSTRKRTEFWRNAAFFARTTLRGSLDPVTGNRKFDVTDNVTGAYRLNTVSGNKTPRQPAAGQPNVADPAFFLTGEIPGAGETWRQAYGRFLTADPQFARATANYLWREMFGLALIEPADSIDLNRLDPAKLAFGTTLQTLHPQLVERLTQTFRSNNYDFRAMLRLMANSSAYQLSVIYTPGSWNETWSPYFARHYARRLSAEALLDSIFIATSVGADLPVSDSTPVKRAMMLPDTLELGNRAGYGRFLTTFGRGDRDETFRTDESGIAQSLSLLNDTLITTRVRTSATGSTVQKTLNATKDPAQIVENLYLATLSRRPSAAESAKGIEHLKSGDLNRKTEDFQYVLINSLEFLFN